MTVQLPRGTFDGRNSGVSGWGRTSRDSLSEVDLGECLFREVLTDEQVKAGDDDGGKSPSIIPE
jgi:hypothetical protein